MNLLDALIRLGETKQFCLPKKGQDYDNTIQEVGSGLEAFIKLLFVGQHPQPEALEQAFCFQGSANHPPDLITRSPQIAFEIKKIQSSKGDLQLNSSYPEQYLTKDNFRLTEECKRVLAHNQIPLIYAIGTVRNGTLDRLWLVDGALYAASRSIYADVGEAISDSIASSGINNLYNTAELAQVREIDPLKITTLRVRGMWIIKHPAKVFEYMGDLAGKVTVLLSKETYLSFPISSRDEAANNHNISMKFTQCKNPDNPSSRKQAVVIEL